jgi:hypothetical protein
LPEADRRRLQESAALAEWRLAGAAEGFEVRLRIAPPVAALAFDLGVCAVDLDETLGARAGGAVQAVNVLRDDRLDFPGALETHDRCVHRVWPRIAEGVSPLEFVIPVLDARRFGAHEVLKVDRLAALPDALRTAKSGMPLPVEMPAPVKMSARCEARRWSARVTREYASSRRNLPSADAQLARARAPLL